MMIPEIEADLVAIARDEAFLEERRFVAETTFPTYRWMWGRWSGLRPEG